MDFTYTRHAEKGIDDFTSLDGTIRFYGFVRAILLKRKAADVLDFGAGRGVFWHDDPSVYRRHIRDLRATGAQVTACDVDPAVMSHPCSARQVVITPGAPLPFADASFDTIVSDMTFEHIDEPENIARELLRILRPGGYICARTPNGLGYVRLLTALVPNRLHARVLRQVQPDRKAEDVFPTVYRMNSPAQIRALFPGARVCYYFDSAEPSYYFGSRVLYEAFMLLHRVLPQRFATTLCVFIEKPA